MVKRLNQMFKIVLNMSLDTLDGKFPYIEIEMKGGSLYKGTYRTFCTYIFSKIFMFH